MCRKLGGLTLELGKWKEACRYIIIASYKSLEIGYFFRTFQIIRIECFHKACDGALLEDNEEGSKATKTLANCYKRMTCYVCTHARAKLEP